MSHNNTCAYVATNTRCPSLVLSRENDVLYLRVVRVMCECLQCKIALRLYSLLMCKLGCKKLSKYLSNATHPRSSRGKTTPTAQNERKVCEFGLMLMDGSLYHIRPVGKRQFRHPQDHIFDECHQRLTRRLSSTKPTSQPSNSYIERNDMNRTSIPDALTASFLVVCVYHRIEAR